MHMRKIMLVMLAALFVFSSVCYGNENNWGNTDTNALLGKVLPNYLVTAGSKMGGVYSMVSGANIVPTSYSLVRIPINTVGLAMTLAAGVPGQVMTIIGVNRIGSGTAVITPAVVNGYATITLDAVLESVTLLYIDDVIGWVVIGLNGATIA